MSQYTASTLDVTADYMGEALPLQINNVAWNGNSFTGSIDGISVSGTDNNGSIVATGNYYGNRVTATGTVTSWS